MFVLPYITQVIGIPAGLSSAMAAGDGPPFTNHRLPLASTASCVGALKKGTGVLGAGPVLHEPVEVKVMPMVQSVGGAPRPGWKGDAAETRL